MNTAQETRRMVIQAIVENVLGMDSFGRCIDVALEMAYQAGQCSKTANEIKYREMYQRAAECYRARAIELAEEAIF